MAGAHLLVFKTTLLNYHSDIILCVHYVTVLKESISAKALYVPLRTNNAREINP